MKRRDFLKLSQMAGIGLAMGGFPVKTFAGNNLLKLLAKQTAENGRVLVLIQLIGGNDGLNTIIPIDQYEALAKARNNLLIPEQKILKLADSEFTGMHPAMAGIRAMYDDGLVSITQGVHYPDPDFSHFRSTDIWLTGAEGKQFLNTGWLGRFLDEIYGDESTSANPRAVQIGSSISIGLQGPKITMGTAISDVSNFYNIVNGSVGSAPNTPAGNELSFIRHIIQQTNKYNGAIQVAAQKANNLSSLYPQGSLAEQLKIVARLIAGGLQTPVYIVSLTGFDTHSWQADTSDHTLGNHAGLLSQLSSSLTAFFDDCSRLNIADRIAAMTCSEFGRRIKSNGSMGTDHGTSQPVMVFSQSVNPGIIGSNPVIPSVVTANDNLSTQMDFRAVYAAVLADWFKIKKETVDKMLLAEYEVPAIFKKTDKPPPVANDQQIKNYPNPFAASTTIKFTTPDGHIKIDILDAAGRCVRTLVNRQYSAGTYEIAMDRNGLPAGAYICRIVSNNTVKSAKMIVADTR